MGGYFIEVYMRDAYKPSCLITISGSVLHEMVEVPPQHPASMNSTVSIRRKNLYLFLY